MSSAISFETFLKEVGDESSVFAQVHTLWEGQTDERHGGLRGVREGPQAGPQGPGPGGKSHTTAMLPDESNG